MMTVPLHTIDNLSSSSNVEGGQPHDDTTDASSSSITTILVHGLDSSSKTWQATMENISTPCIAVDQRGSGYSPLGDPNDFSQDALVEDLHQVITRSSPNNDNKKVVLIGHSLGGRIVLGYAAKYPQYVAALVIEDMDIAPRTPNAHGVVQLKPYEGIFDRQRDSQQAIIEALENVGYPKEFIEKGLKTGRIEPSPFAKTNDGNNDSSSSEQSWWSHINPDFRKLCYQHVLSTTQAKKDCQTIATLLSSKKHAKLFPCHVLVAGPDGTVCIEESIQEMREILSNDHLTIHRYPTAGHSIHSTAPEEYLKTIRSIIEQASSSLS